MHWVRRFFAVGPISTLGLVGDSGRTVRSLSAASKPRITQRTTRYTPSIQVEGAEHIFRVREFRFLLGKICVAHSVAHSFIFFYVALYRLRMESRPRARGGIASIGEVLCTGLPSGTCVNQKTAWSWLTPPFGNMWYFLCPSHPSRCFCWHESGVMLTGGLVGDSGRTVRSLSAASKPRITQRTTRYTPSIQVEGAEHIFLFFSVFFFLFL